MKTFAQKLKEKFPDQFPKDADGNTICPRCGISCPIGWEQLVENLMTAIDRHIKTPKHKQKYVLLHTSLSWLHKICCSPIFKLAIMCSPLRPKVFYVAAQVAELNKKHFIKKFFNEYLRKLYYVMIPAYRHKQYSTEPIVIHQIKEKFGGLRFYYSGGDDYIRSIVSYTEFLSERTSQISGDHGSLYVKKGFYKTLTPAEARKERFQKPKLNEDNNDN